MESLFKTQNGIEIQSAFVSITSPHDTNIAVELKNDPVKFHRTLFLMEVQIRGRRLRKRERERYIHLK